MNPVEMLYLKRQLSKYQFKVHSLHYPSARHDIAHNTQLLKQKIRQLDLSNTHIVAHSLGGIMTLCLLAEEQLPIVDRVVLLGSPLNGSYVADRVSQWPIISRLIKNSLKNGLDGQYVLPSQTVDIGMIAGVSESIGIGKLIGGMPEASDGTVLLSETKHPILSQHTVVKKSHTGLLFSKEVAQLTANFLNTGRFQ
ncbi:alpha/beta hydrolase [Leucothrix sargassi]|nr:alpha/beta hydrolase [Leucothrix sargassi]